ncbi:Protein transport protein sec20 [Sporothrix epigloea]|uniref:Protein transport protein sec20 n=1 Tax=Sporothrix epigloea TaxID=1892477 RepID=A0ABP0DT47_9PEZI
MATFTDINDRLVRAHDVLVDLRRMIDRLAGKQPADDQRRSSIDSSRSLPADTETHLFFYLDKEATDELASDIADTLRDVQDDYDLLCEDALDLGVIKSAAEVLDDGSEFDAGNHRQAGRSLPAPSLGVSLRSSGVPGGSTSSAITGDGAVAASVRSSTEGAGLQRGLLRLRDGLSEARREFRAAQLAARRHRQDALRNQHWQILASYVDEADSEDEDGDEDGRGEEGRTSRSATRARLQAPATKHVSATTSAAADVTAALRQTHARIAGEVGRSEFAAQTLAESSRALAELGDRYGGGGASSGGDINTSLKSARTLVRSLVTAHKSDTWYLQTAMYMVAVTIGWLLFRRLLYGPLWLLIWWPVRTIFGTAVWVGRASSGGSSKNAITSVKVGEYPVTSVATSLVMATSDVAAEVHVAEASVPVHVDGRNSGSMLEEVGRHIDASTVSGSEPTATDEAIAMATESNPMKRMWEEPVEAAKYEEQQQAEEKEKEQADQEHKPEQIAEDEQASKPARDEL